MYRGAKCLRNIGTAVQRLKKHLAVFISDGSIYITEYILSKQNLRLYHVSGNVSRRLVAGPFRFQGLAKVPMSNLPHPTPFKIAGELGQTVTMSNLPHPTPSRI